MRYIEHANAKINLYLDVTARRADGYHEIESIMQEVSLHDTVQITKNDYACENRITVTCTDERIPTDRRNIVWRCAEAFFASCDIRHYDVTIAIRKRIPSGAGLGGGSSDGAATLRLLNQAYETSLSTDALCAIGAKIGADIPFCIVGKICVCRGIGEIIEPVPMPFLPFGVLIAFPDGTISTPEAYKHLDKTPADNGIHTLAQVLMPMRGGGTPRSLYNAFERAILPIHVGARTLKRRMLELGAIVSLMSGSGPSVYGLFEDRVRFDEATDRLTQEGYAVYPCAPIV